ncbi:hypothetical protein KY329_00570 [Candidatus Woesearchaeota archaeon]|nr:hypothetical protein [Candidatus Woesearchaeota archaeon]
MVSVQIVSPTWFFGLDGSFELIAAVIAFVVALTALKIWRMTRERPHGWFSASFLLMAIGLAVRGVADLAIEKVVTCAPAIREALPAVPGMSRTAFVFLAGYLSNIILTLAAYVILVCLAFKIRDKAIALLLLLLIIPTMMISASYFLNYYWLSTILLAFITLGHYRHYRETKKGRVVTLAFLFLALAQVQFVISALSALVPLARDIIYVTAHSTQILGFLMILLAYLRTVLK